MSYQEAIDYLMQRLPMFSRVGGAAVKYGLQNITALCEALGNPQQNKKFIHIAGTNGKGSVSHILAATLQQAGYKTGLYTSPHLVDIRERIRINGAPISETFLIRFVESVIPLVDTIEPSYFELNVAMAYSAFAAEDVDVAVIETGMGGRLDSTNIIHPVLSVITNISYDHTDMLGNTLAEIATEKAGIIKDGVPVVIGISHPETEGVFIRESLRHQSPVYFADSVWDMVKTGRDAYMQHFKAVHRPSKHIYPISTDLLGSYQAANIITALTAVEVLQHLGWNVNTDTCIQALQSVKRTTGLQGRWDRIGTDPDLIIDVAHNPAGMALAIESLQSLLADKAPSAVCRIVCGFVKDKDITATLKQMPTGARYYVTQADMPRALDAFALLELAQQNGLNGNCYPRVSDALQAVLHEATTEDVILITGSFYLIGEAIPLLEKMGDFGF